MKKIKVVVTGGAGFIGSNLVQALVEKGDTDVVVIDDLSTGNKKNLESVKKKITFINGSILDAKLLRKHFKGAQCVFHQAALPSVPKSIEMPIETNLVNSHGTLCVFVAAHEAGVKRVVYATSSYVYGDSPTLPKVETMPFNPLSPYAAQKMMGEYYGKLFFKIFGLETVGLRYFNVFGPRQDPKSKYSAVIPLFINMMIEGKGPTIFGDGKTTRDFTYVENVVQANLKASVAPNVGGEVFNIACNESISLNDLVLKINNELGTKIKVTYSTKRGGDIDHSLADIKKAKKILGFKPEVLFDEGLKHTIALIKKSKTGDN